MPNISLTKTQLMLIGGALAVIVVVVVLFIIGGHKGSTAAPVTIKVWGTEPSDAWKPIIDGYQVLRPNATVQYTQVAAANYNDTLLNALAAGSGPDVFLIGNHDLLNRIDLLAPAPAAAITAAGVQSFFPAAAAQDLVYKGSVYGLPLYMDTLALVYNKQLFDQAGIATPPTTWQEVLNVIPKLRTQDVNGQITQAAIALGGSEKSVDHATDIVNLLMLQNGVSLADDAGNPAFAFPPGPAAFSFYLQFADAGGPAYTWNDSMQNSLEAFAAQKVAMILAYQGDIATIKKQSPFLDLAVAPVPQAGSGQAVNYPSYESLAVWTGGKVQPWAWDFAAFAATDPTAQAGYLQYTGHPAALRSLIAKEDSNPDLQLFGRAALTARSWKMGDYDKIKAIFSTAVQNVTSGAKTPDAALQDAATQAGQLVRK